MLEFDVIMRGARDVARAARAGARLIDRLMHSGEHFWMLAHAEIVVAAPDCDRTFRTMRVPSCLGKGALATDNVGKNAVAPFALQLPDCAGKFCFEIHSTVPAQRAKNDASQRFGERRSKASA